MKKKVLIIVSVIVILFAVVGGMIIHKKTVKPIVTSTSHFGEWYDNADLGIYSLEVQIYENGKCKLVGSRGETVSFKVEKNKVEELQQKIDELKFKDISEHITIWALDYPSSSITVNYKDKNSHRVVKSAGHNGGNGEQWEIDNYDELLEEIWSLVPKEKQNKLEAKIRKPLFETVISRACVVLGVGIVVLIISIFISKKKRKNQKFQNIYTGENVKDKFESLGYAKYSDANKKIHLKYNENETTFDYSTNTEYSYNDLKFVICRMNEENLIILVNVDMKENIAHRKLRESFADTWTYFKSAYRFNIKETLEFEYENNKIKISIN